MNCCVNCFCDRQIKTMIKANGELGDCDFCEAKNAPVYSLDKQSDLTDLISEVFSMYEEADDGKPLFDSIINDWSIFEKTLPSSSNLVSAFSKVLFGNEKSYIHNKRVRIPNGYIEEYGIFSGHSWEEFSDVIKRKNRFCNGYFKPEQFISFLSYSITKYPKGTKFYRARICDYTGGYKKEEMSAPPAGKRKSGRVNPEGIGVLYLASDERTALNEVRASVFDFITVGTFTLLKEIKVVNLSELNRISPMVYSSGLESLAANIKIFGDIAKEIAKPLRRNDSPLEYLPTQYITEFIKSNGYSGVTYKSTMETGGEDIAVFNESLLQCTEVHNVEIQKVEYIYNEVVS